MVHECGVSICQGCRAVSLPRSSYRYRRRPKKDEVIIDALNTLVDRHPSIGFWQCHHRLRTAGHAWNHKRVYRVYAAMGLNIRRRRKKRLPLQCNSTRATRLDTMSCSQCSSYWQITPVQEIHALRQTADHLQIPPSHQIGKRTELFHRDP